MLPKVDKMGEATRWGYSLLLEWNSGDKWAVAEGRGNVSLFAAKGKKSGERSRLRCKKEKVV